MFFREKKRCCVRGKKLERRDRKKYPWKKDARGEGGTRLWNESYIGFPLEYKKMYIFEMAKYDTVAR